VYYYNLYITRIMKYIKELENLSKIYIHVFFTINLGCLYQNHLQNLINNTQFRYKPVSKRTCQVPLKKSL
jgi:hypothetical protein